MPTAEREIETLANREYQWGFESAIESESAPPGLSEDTVRFISARKNEPQWMLDWRLKAFRHWKTMEEPHDWPKIHYDPIDYQASSYFSAPKPKKSLDEVDPELLAVYEKLGIPLNERKALLGVEEEGQTPMAVDAVFDSVSVATTFRKSLSSAGVLFCVFGEAVGDYPAPVPKDRMSVV